MATREGNVSKLMDARAAARAAGNDSTDQRLDESRKDRTNNPIDLAKRGSISAELNSDSGKYRSPETADEAVNK